MDAAELKKIVAEAVNQATKKPRPEPSRKKDDTKDAAWKKHLSDDDKKLPLKQQMAAGYQKLNAYVVAKKIVDDETELLYKELTELRQKVTKCEKKLKALAEDSSASGSSSESSDDDDASAA